MTDRPVALAYGDYDRLVSFEHYRDVYGGEKVTAVKSFNRLNRKAELAVMFYTLNKASKFEEGTREYIDLLDTICEVIDLYQDIQTVGFTKGASAGDVTVAYSIDTLENKRKVLDIVKERLTYTGALYRGV